MRANRQNYETAIENIREAQDLLEEAIRLLDEAVRLTSDRNAEAYLVDHLKIMASSGHGFMSRDLNCDTWIERLQEVIDEEDDDEE